MPTETSRVISDNGLSATAQGYRIDIRLPWYRSLPVSTVEVGPVSIDGIVVDPNEIAFELGGKAYPLSEMASQVHEVWFVLDSAFLNLKAPALNPKAPVPVKGSAHEVCVTLNLYPPYIRGLKRMTRDCKTLRIN
jgi:hypothetical protein